MTTDNEIGGFFDEDVMSKFPELFVISAEHGEDESSASASEGEKSKTTMEKYVVFDPDIEDYISFVPGDLSSEEIPKNREVNHLFIVSEEMEDVSPTMWRQIGSQALQFATIYGLLSVALFLVVAIVIFIMFKRTKRKKSRAVTNYDGEIRQVAAGQFRSTLVEFRGELSRIGNERREERRFELVQQVDNTFTTFADRVVQYCNHQISNLPPRFLDEERRGHSVLQEVLNTTNLLRDSYPRQHISQLIQPETVLRELQQMRDTENVADITEKLALAEELGLQQSTEYSAAFNLRTSLWKEEEDRALADIDRLYDLLTTNVRQATVAAAVDPALELVRLENERLQRIHERRLFIQSQQVNDRQAARVEARQRVERNRNEEELRRSNFETRVMTRNRIFDELGARLQKMQQEMSKEFLRRLSLRRFLDQWFGMVCALLCFTVYFYVSLSCSERRDWKGFLMAQLRSICFYLELPDKPVSDSVCPNAPSTTDNVAVTPLSWEAINSFGWSAATYIRSWTVKEFSTTESRTFATSINLENNVCEASTPGPFGSILLTDSLDITAHFWSFLTSAAVTTWTNMVTSFGWREEVWLIAGFAKCLLNLLIRLFLPIIIFSISQFIGISRWSIVHIPLCVFTLMALQTPLQSMLHAARGLVFLLSVHAFIFLALYFDTRLGWRWEGSRDGNLSWLNRFSHWEFRGCLVYAVYPVILLLLSAGTACHDKNSSRGLELGNYANIASCFGEMGTCVFQEWGKR